MNRHAAILALALILAGGSTLGAVPLAAAETNDEGVVTASNWDAAQRGAFDQAKLVRELMRRRGGDGAAAAQLVQMSREFDPDIAAESFEVLADAHLAAGQLNLAADT